MTLTYFKMSLQVAFSSNMHFSLRLVCETGSKLCKAIHTNVHQNSTVSIEQWHAAGVIL